MTRRECGYVRRMAPRPTATSSKWSLWSENSFLCIGSKNSVLSIGSIGSACSIGF